MTNTEYATGPLNENYGYDAYTVAPIDQVRAAAELTDDAMWAALERCDWTDVDTLPASARVVRSYSVDGDTIELER